MRTSVRVHFGPITPIQRRPPYLFALSGNLKGAKCSGSPWRVNLGTLTLAVAEASAYFLTQITRTTAAFASGDPPAASTPLALRNSRTVSAGTSAACAAGAAFGGPATTSGFNSAMPANLPSPSSAAAPEKPSPGAGDNARSLLLPIDATDALTLLTAAPPPWLCGSAMPVRSSADFVASPAMFSGFSPRTP